MNMYIFKDISFIQFISTFQTKDAVVVRMSGDFNLRLLPIPKQFGLSFKLVILRSRQKTWLKKDGSHCEDASRSTG